LKEIQRNASKVVTLFRFTKQNDADRLNSGTVQRENDQMLVLFFLRPAHQPHHRAHVAATPVVDEKKEKLAADEEEADFGESGRRR